MSLMRVEGTVYHGPRCPKCDSRVPDVVINASQYAEGPVKLICPNCANTVVFSKAKSEEALVLGVPDNARRSWLDWEETALPVETSDSSSELLESLTNDPAWKEKLQARFATENGEKDEQDHSPAEGSAGTESSGAPSKT